MSLTRLLLRASPNYRRVGDHFVQVERSRYGNPYGVSGVKETYTCVDCGEEHRKANVFSDACGDGQYNTGGEEVTAKCSAADITEKYIWFKRKEGKKKGLQFAIPLFHEEYDTDMRESLQAVQEGRIYDVTFVMDNAEGTAYYCGGINRIG